MLAVIEKLLTLQDTDQRLRSMRQELDAVPGAIASRNQLIDESAARLEESRARSKAIEVEKKTLQVEAASKREQIARYRTQQSQTRKNEEFTALAHEIERAEGDVSGIEDRELALMEEAEALRPAIREAEEAFAAEKSRHEENIASLRGKEGNLRERIAETEAARPRLLEGIDEDMLERYERLFRAKNGRAVVEVEHDVCGGCHMKITAQTGLALRSGKSVVSCPQCGRILHLPA